MEKCINQMRSVSEDIKTYNPDEIALAERLQGVIKDEELLCGFGEQFAEAYTTDEQSPERTFKRIFKQYIEGSHEIRFIINDIFLTLCGFEINTLLNQASENIDDGESDDE